eukprot:5170585-Pleurochrysis_carterae.AAC.1
MLHEVEEIKGKNDEAKAARPARRGKQIGFVGHDTCGTRVVNVLAAGHDEKVPLLLVCSYGSTIAGRAHEKPWRAQHADGRTAFYSLTMKQPHMHEALSLIIKEPCRCLQ